MKKILTVLFLALLVVALAVGGVRLLKLRKAELARLHPPKIYPVRVDTMRVRKTSFVLTLTGLGIVQSTSDVVVSTKLAGKILYLKPLGSVVKKGDVVAKLDASATLSKIASTKAGIKSLEAKLKSVELSLRNMILTHRRTAQLLKVKGASIEQFQKEEDAIASLKSTISSIKSQILSLESTLKELKSLLGYSIIKAPVDGVISRRFANAGDVAMPGRPICQISTNGGKYLLVRLPQDIKPRGVLIHGKYYSIEALNSTFEGLNQYKVDYETDANAGQRVEISIVIYRAEGIKLPFDAILNDNGNNYVFVVKGKRAVPVRVKILASGEEGVAVSSADLVGKRIVVAKPDILMKLLGGVEIIPYNKKESGNV